MRRPVGWVTRIWLQSLWLAGPLALAFTLWLALGWQRFSQIETAIPAEQNTRLTEVLEYEARRLLVGWADKSIRTAHPEDAFPLKTIQLKVPKSDLKALDSKLPQSGKRYVQGRLVERQNEFKIKVRYRGNNPIHWRGDKKSLRVRLTNDKLYKGMDTFELMAPADRAVIGPYLGAKLAKEMDLLTAKTELVWLYLNGESRGLYTLVETIDEQTLVNNSQMPGDIYAGEVAKRDAFVGADNRLFHNAGLWEKLAHNSDYPQTSMAPLHLLVNWLTAPQVNYEQLPELVDYPSFARFYLFHQLLQSNNIDQFHNWRLYFDHSRGRFFPIVWDPEGWPIDANMANLGLVFDRLLADKQFEEEINRQFHQLNMSERLQTFQHTTQQIIDRLKYWVDIDPYSSIDIHYYDSDEFFSAAQAKLTRMAKAFTLNRPKPEIKPQPQVQVWQGEIRFDGINHIRYPVKVLPGSKILLGPKALLVFHHTLEMQGNEQGMIEVTSSTDEPFAAFVIKGHKADGSSLSYCRFSNGSQYKNPVINYTAMLSLHEVSKVVIDHCRFSNNHSADDMVHGVYADITINHSIFEQGVADGLDLELSQAYISNSYFKNNGREGIDLMHSDVVLRNVQLVDNLDTALSVGQSSRVRLENSVVKGNKTALLVKDSSVMRLTYSEVFGNERIVELKQANDNYADGGVLFVYHSKLFDNRRFFDVEKNSKMTIVDSYLSPRFYSSKKRIVIDELTDAFEARTSKGPLTIHKVDAAWFKSLDQKISPVTDLWLRGRKHD